MPPSKGSAGRVRPLAARVPARAAAKLRAALRHGAVWRKARWAAGVAAPLVSAGRASYLIAGAPSARADFGGSGQS
ncbi:MAG: hypothetical protein ACREIR_22305, partial [Geminicoccaceae bacterium]